MIDARAPIDRALASLKALIADGWEYPDAEWRVACWERVSPGELRAAYDESFL